MRLSLWTSACTSAVLTTALTLPLLAQSAPQQLTLTVAGTGKNRIELRCKDAKDLTQCVDGVQGLSSKQKSQLKAMAPQLEKQLKQELSQAKDGSGSCFALRVFAFPKGFPEKNGKVQAKVSDCTSAALVKEKSAVMQRARVKGQ